MIMILSPAKTLNLDNDANNLPLEWTAPLAELSQQRETIVAALKEHASSATKLSKLLKTSPKITAAAQTYWKNMSSDGASASMSNSTTGRSKNSATKPAIMTFDGAAYAGLSVRDALSTRRSHLEYLQDRLRIVDPLYGWLRPMDAIEAYRLEMASKGVFAATTTNTTITKTTKLEDFWKPSIASCLSSEAKAICLVNLASDEYSAAVDTTTATSLDGKNIITTVKIVFRHGGRVVSVHAKRARGLMVRYAALNAIETVEGLTAFDSEGYSYRPDQSTYENVTTTNPAAAAVSAHRETTPNKTKTKANKKSKKDAPTLVFDRSGTGKK
jgi:hypothetical protein